MKILVVDDHTLIREALRGVLLELKPDVAVIDASSCREAQQLAESNAAELGLILFDLGLPDGDGFDALGELCDNYPAIAIVVLSASKDRDSVTRALERGARGFIPKSATRAVMIRALQLVFDGGIYVPPEILQYQKQAHPRTPASAAMSPADLGLTERQIDVLALMMQGKSNKAICRELDLAEATVKNHVTAVFKCLQVTNRTEAVLAVTELGWKLSRVKT
jgi:DNA-binding NarL/FixJ family response regulator